MLHHNPLAKPLIDCRVAQVANCRRSLEQREQGDWREYPTFQPSNPHTKRDHFEDRGMSTDSTASRSYYPLADVLEGVIDKLSNPSPFALTTGLRGLDSLLRGGLTIGSVSAVAGRPSMGRGEFARNVAFSVAKQGHGVLYFSPERSRHMIALDGLAQILELEPYWLRMPSNQAVARDLLNTHSSAIASLSELPIVVDDTPSLKQEELRERIVAALRLQHSQETPIKLVVVDSVECLHFSPSANADLLGSCMTRLTLVCDLR